MTDFMHFRKTPPIDFKYDDLLPPQYINKKVLLKGLKITKI